MKVHGGKRDGSGRKKGTPNKATAEIKDIARQYGPAALKEAAKLAGLVDDGTGKAESEQARLAALNIILDRAYGKAAQTITGDTENPLRITMTVDRPPNEDREQWLARRSRELGLGAVMGATARPANGRDHS